MDSLHFRKSERERNRRSLKAAVHAAPAEQKTTLYWTALIITGNAACARKSIADAGSLAHAETYAFGDWLIRWGRSPNALAAVHRMRVAMSTAAVHYAGSTCAHRTHEPLAPEQVRTLHGLDPYRVIQQLDMLARTTLVVCGCQRASLSECARFLELPPQCVVAAYCRALDWFGRCAKSAAEPRDHGPTPLHLVR